MRAMNETRRGAGAGAARRRGGARRRSRAATARRWRPPATVAHVLPGLGRHRRPAPRRAGSRTGARTRTSRGRPSALAAHEAIEESPAHLANVLAPASAGSAWASRAPPCRSGGDGGLPHRDLRRAARRRRRRARSRRTRACARRSGASARGSAARRSPAMRPSTRSRARPPLRPAPRATRPGAARTSATRALALRRLAAVDVFVASAPEEAAPLGNLRGPALAAAWGWRVTTARQRGGSRRAARVDRGGVYRLMALREAAAGWRSSRCRPRPRARRRAARSGCRSSCSTPS